MNAVLKIVELGRSIRSSYNLKVKQPLAEMVICTNLSNESLKDFGSIIQDELNIKVLTWVTDLNELEEISFKLNFKVAGAIFGKNVNNVKKYVGKFTATQKQLLLSKGSIPIVISNESYELLK